jgi:hypothetical protein
MFFLALYYVTFQCQRYNVLKKNLKFFFAHIKLKKPTQKVAYFWQLEVLFLCNTDCPKQPRTSFPFFKFFYPTISGRISALDPKPPNSEKKLSPHITSASRRIFSSILYLISKKVWVCVRKYVLVPKAEQVEFFTTIFLTSYQKLQIFAPYNHLGIRQDSDFVKFWPRTLLM